MKNALIVFLLVALFGSVIGAAVDDRFFQVICTQIAVCFLALFVINFCQVKP